MHKTLIFRPIPPFEIGPLNVNPLTLFQPSLPLPQTVPFCYACDSTPSNITNRPKHLDSSMTVTHVARVTKPFRETPSPPPPKRGEGVSLLRRRTQGPTNSLFIVQTSSSSSPSSAPRTPCFTARPSALPRPADPAVRFNAPSSGAGVSKSALTPHGKPL